MATIVIIFPAGYVATKYPGYFWNTKTQTLFSIKIGGELRELKLTKPSHWNNFFHGNPKGGNGAYRISHKGQRRILFVNVLKELTESHTIFPEAK